MQGDDEVRGHGVTRAARQRAHVEPLAAGEGQGASRAREQGLDAGGVLRACGHAGAQGDPARSVELGGCPRTQALGGEEGAEGHRLGHEHGEDGAADARDEVRGAQVGAQERRGATQDGVVGGEEDERAARAVARVAAHLGVKRLEQEGPAVEPGQRVAHEVVEGHVSCRRQERPTHVAWMPVASRQEERERRRQQREAREAAAARASQRTRTLRIGCAALLLAIVAIGAAVALARGGGGADLPERRITDLGAAVRAAGCELRTLRSEGRDHVPPGRDVRYRANPPSSGPHEAVPAADGVYEPGNTPRPEAWVHTLEHGRIIFQYRPGADEERVDQLRALFEEEVRGAPSYHVALMENNTRMPYEVAAVGWTRHLGCNEVNDRTWDALRAFRDRYVDRAPELIP